MSPLVLLRCAHVLFAVLGTGLIGAIALASRSLAENEGTRGASALVSLSRWASLGLLLVFLTGVACDFAAEGAYHKQWWFRLAGLSMFVAGGMLGRVRALIRRLVSGGVQTPVLAGVRGFSLAACAVIAWIVVLMELRPFQ